MLTLALASCGLPAAPSARVLFIGNSYTFENDLPQMVAALAQAGGRPLGTGMLAVGGATLAQHLGTLATADTLAEQRWDFVVLQEQSVIPALASQRSAQMYPAARELIRAVRARGARPVLLLTWGRRDGLAEAGFRDFAGMQAQLTAGYLALADELDVAVAPAGEAWRAALANDPGLALWQDDGSHPSQLGSYLTACVVYAALFRASPEGLPIPAGIDADTARRLQVQANVTVQRDLARWHLPAQH
jgi:hypothetical protein